MTRKRKSHRRAAIDDGAYRGAVRFAVGRDPEQGTKAAHSGVCKSEDLALISTRDMSAERAVGERARPRKLSKASVGDQVRQGAQD